MSPSQQVANNLFAQALPYILQTLGAIGLLIFTWLGTLVAKYVKNQDVAAILLRARDAAASIVGELEQTVVTQIKTNGLPLDAAGIAKVDAIALAKLKEHLGPKGIAELQGVIEPGTLDAKCVTWLQAAVANMNTAQAAPAVVNVAPTVRAVAS